MIKSTQTILIVDLSDGDGSDYEKLLQQDSKVRYRCFIASLETQILALSQSHQFDAIILESHESDRSVLPVIEWLKAQMGENCPPIIVIDRNDANLATRAIKAGAVNYLVREELSTDILVRSLQEAIALNQNHSSQYQTNQADLKNTQLLQDLSTRLKGSRRNAECVEFVIDISDRKRAEVALRESEARLALELADSKQLQFISSQLVQEENIDALYEQILDAAIALMRSDMGSMQMLHPDRNELQLLAWKGFDPASAAFWQWVRVDSESTCGMALRTGQRAIVPDVETCEFMAGSGDLDAYRGSGIRAVQTTPLISRSGRVVGMISTHWQEPHQPSERELGLLDVLARQAADLIEQRQAEAALRESEERLRLALSAGEMGTWQYRFATDEHILDPTMRQLLGLPTETDVIPLEDFLHIVHEDDRPQVRREIERCLQEGGEIDLEFRVVWQDGSVIWLKDRGKAIRGEDDRPLFLTGAATDITQRKQAEIALQESEEKYRSLFNSMDEAYAVVEVMTGENGEWNDFLFLEVNPAFVKQTGMEYPVGRKATELLGTTNPQWVQVYGRVAETGEPIRFEEGEATLGRVFDLYVFRLGGEGSRRVAVLFTDITDRKRTEAAIAADLRDTQLLRDLGARLITEGDIQSLYQEIVTVAITLMQADAGTVQLLDEATQELLLLATQGIEPPMIEHFYRVDARSNTPCGKALAAGDRTFVDFDVPQSEDPDGSMRMHVEAGYLSAQSTPLVSRSGKPIGMVSTHWRQRYRPSDRELRFFDLLVRQAADLIEQRQAEAAQREAQESLQIAVEAAEMGTWDLDLTKDFSGHRSLRHDRVFGYDDSQPEWGQEIARRHVVEEDLEIFDGAFARALETGELKFEVRVRWSNGSIHWMACDGRFYFDADGKPVRAAGVNFEITERKHAEAQLQRAAEIDAFRLKLSDALRSLADPVQIETEACCLLGEQLGVDLAYYVEIHEAEGYARVNQHYSRGDSPLIVGDYRLAEYGWSLPLMRRDETIVIADTQSTNIIPDAERAAMATIGMIGFVALPLIKGEVLVGALAVNEPAPREWTEAEVELVRETAERIWAAAERARTELALRESEAKYRSLFEAINDAFALLEVLYNDDNRPVDCRFLEVSPSFESQTGLPQAQGKTLRELIPSVESGWFEQYHQALVTNDLVHFEIYQEYLNIWFEVDVLPYGNPQDRQVTIVFRNINERKQAEANQIKLIREQAAREQEHQRAETLAELDRAKTQFFSNVSHEFRTPLTLLLPPLEDALRDFDEVEADSVFLRRSTFDHPLSELQRERLELAYRNSLRLLKLVNSLLDFSRVEAGRLQANYEATDLSTYTTELASTFRSAIENGGLELVVNCPPLPLVYVDRQMWEKIVLNLLSNAFKFTFEGTIAVSLQAIPEDRVELIVRDTGSGISAQELPQIFERFYQIRGRRGRSSEGSGIGLSLVRELVKLHGGEIEVSSEIDRGTIFSVTIPTAKADSSSDRPEQNETQPLRNLPTPTSTAIAANSFVAEAQRWLPPQEKITLPSEPPTDNSKRERILIVDDNADLQNYLQRLLDRDYQVETANNGLAALNKIRAAVGEDSSNYDLVLADIMMPEMDGFELLRSLRADPNTREIPIILLSARAGEESRVQGLAAGADDYLIKPFSSRELLARVNTHLKLVRMRREATYRQRVMEEIQKLNATLEEKVQERTVQLQEINQELEAFSYAVSHDLQTPLSYISSFAQKLQTKLNSTQIDLISQSYLKIMVEATEQSRTMVQNLLEFSRMGQTPLHLSSVPMDLLVQQVREYLKPQLEGRTLHWQIEPLPEVQGNREMLRLVLQNLLSNAVKYTRDRPNATITIGSSDRERETIFWVRDNGVGFDINYHDRLFGFFQRLHSQEQFEGTGIGLAQVRRIIHRHGGRIWAEGAVDAGATFYFSLPK